MNGNCSLPKLGGGRQLPPEMEEAAEAKRKEFEAAMASAGGGAGERGGGSKPSGPRTVVCYICGREFGRSSIGIHEKQCAKKWEDAESQKPPRERKPLPLRPDVQEGATREEWNEAARAAHEDQAMSHCPGCGRTFKDEDTLRKHLKSCKAGGGARGFGGGGGRQLPPEMEAAAEAQRKEFEAKLAAEGGGGAAGSDGGRPRGPRTVVCYICGREFGKSSIGIHEKQCAKKWEDAEAQKDPHERRPLPTRPEVGQGVSREEFNEAAKAAYEAQSMVHCPGCGRRFKDEETMQRHLRGCKEAPRGSFGGGGGRQLPPEMEAAAEAKRQEMEAQMGAEGGGGGGRSSSRAGGRAPGPRTVVCYICGREFGKSSIGIHEKQCAKKWEEAEAQKPPHERKPLPTRPEVQEGATREERNEAARATHEAQAMAHCPGCGRTFKDEDTLRKHMRSCQAASQGHGFGGGGGRQLPPEMEAAAEAQRKEFEAKLAAEGGGAGGGGGGRPGSRGPRSSGPRMVVCHICGREFGRSSIGIHVKQCAKKWEETEDQKPPHERKPVPQRPDVDEGASREEWNEAAKAAHEAQAMSHCPGCARRFKDDETMRKHMRACKAVESLPAVDPPPFGG